MSESARARRPVLVIFDVNETLSDLSPMAERFEDVGAPGHLARQWFASVLRDGFALTAVGASRPFAAIAQEILRVLLPGQPLTRGLDDAVAHVMGGFQELPVHPDVVPGLRALHGLGLRLVTLSNGAASVADSLLGRAGVRGELEALLTVEDAGAWKPAAAAYAHALETCAVDADQAMLVAVHAWDVDGAARSGLRTAWVDRSGERYPSHFNPAEVRATSLLDLAEQLRRLEPPQRPSTV